MYPIVVFTSEQSSERLACFMILRFCTVIHYIWSTCTASTSRNTTLKMNFGGRSFCFRHRAVYMCLCDIRLFFAKGSRARASHLPLDNHSR